MNQSWHSYPSIFALGHRALAELLHDPVLVEEKIDGSQFSFGVFWEDGERVVRCRSKGVQLNVLAPEKMFKAAVDVVEGLPLTPGYTYRAEYLQRPKHNVLAYDRTPEQHLMVFDINTGHEAYMSYDEKAAECARIGLECVPRIFEGTIDNVQQFRDMIDRTSILGGQKIEGVVVKNYARFGQDKKILIGKFVSEAFKEIHNSEWKKANPGSKDIIDALVQSLRTPARWNKAVQHLREAGAITDSPRDIGKLIGEVQADIEKECMDMIVQQLTQWALPKIGRGVVGGLAEWYRDQLLARQFNEVDAEVAA